jgi:hypothetical protein
MTSAYPIPADVLEERVRALAASLGEWPSQRRVMRECRVGAPRADAALTAVKRSGFDPSKPARPLALVPTGADTTAPDTHAPDTPASAVERGDTAVPDAADPGEPTTAAGARGGTSNGPAQGGAPTASPVSAGAPADGEEITADQLHPSARTATAEQVSQVAETPAGTPADAPTGVAVAAPVERGARVPRWPLVLIALGAFVSIWSGWVGLGEMTGFGPIRPLPGIWDEFVINTAITLPIGVEAYAAFALRAWLAPPAAGLPPLARRFACWSALGALALGAAGQIAYHLMAAAGLTQAPWQITAFVSCLPVVVLGCGAALTHLIHRPTDSEVTR